MKRLIGIAFLTFLLAIPATSVLAATPSPTPTPSPTITPTPTSTFTNEQNAAIATIAPPSSCGMAFNPCGGLPWDLPTFPTLSLPSPTIQPTLPSPTPVPATVTPSVTPTPTITRTPTGTLPPTPTSTQQNITDGMSTVAIGAQNLASTLNSQSTQIAILNGTPQGPAQIANQLGQNAGQLFGVARALQMGDVNGAGGLVSFGLLALAFVFLVYIATFAGPVILTLLKLTLQILQIVIQAIRG